MSARPKFPFFSRTAPLAGNQVCEVSSLSLMYQDIHLVLARTPWKSLKYGNKDILEGKQKRKCRCRGGIGK